MTPREILTPEQVAELLAGTQHRPESPKTAQDSERSYSPRYGCCDRCEAVQPALLTFYSDHDWEPELPADSPVRVVVRSLRNRLGRRVILLCGRCIDAVRSQTPAAPETPGRLFTDLD